VAEEDAEFAVSGGHEGEGETMKACPELGRRDELLV